MKQHKAALLVAALILWGMPSGSSHAQATLDMTRVTCADYLAMPPDRSEIFSAWMSGWFNQRLGYVSVGLSDFQRNVASIKQWCTTSPAATIMGALESSRIAPAPGGQVKVDMSLITCKEYATSDAERQLMVASWMSGYFRAARNQPVFDFTRFNTNRRAVGAHCKRNGGETLMSAIQKTAR
jgi:HdeA/HdeB family